eukprot:9497698-Pyramimonas_sp.AAC.1
MQSMASHSGAQHSIALYAVAWHVCEKTRPVRNGSSISSATVAARCGRRFQMPSAVQRRGNEASAAAGSRF